MKRIVLFIIQILFFESVFCQIQSEDSLLQLFEKSSGTAKLEILHELQQNNLYNPKDAFYNEFLLKEASFQDNVKYQSLALSNKVAYHYRLLNTDSIFYYAKIAEDFGLKNNYLNDLFLVKQMIIQYYLNQGNYSLGLKKALDMFEETKKSKNVQGMIVSTISLAKAYQSLNQYDEAIHYLNEALKIDNELKEAPYKTLECYLYLADNYNNKNDAKSVLLYADSLYSEAERIEQLYPAYNLKDFIIGSQLYYADVYIEENRLDEAWQKIEQVDEIIKDTEIPYFTFLLDQIKMLYYDKKRDFENIKKYYDICYEFCKENNLESKLWNLLRFRSEALSEFGIYKESAETYQALLNHTDSVNKNRFLYEVNQLKMDYELNKKENEIIQQKKELELKKGFIIILIILSILLLVTILIIWKNLKLIKNKNYRLFNQIKELTKTKTELLKFKYIVNERTNNLIKNNSSSEYELFERVEAFMNKEKPFMNSDYGRKNLINDMNTNEVYLSKAIRSGADMTIQEYINSWRIEHAKYLLLENVNDTIESISIDSGFTSIRNFYRLFKDSYGMSPNEFRNYVTKSYSNQSSFSVSSNIF